MKQLDWSNHELGIALTVTAALPALAALTVHVMINTALTGATFDIDGGQRLVAG